MIAMDIQSSQKPISHPECGCTMEGFLSLGDIKGHRGRGMPREIQVLGNSASCYGGFGGGLWKLAVNPIFHEVGWAHPHATQPGPSPWRPQRGLNHLG